MKKQELTEAFDCLTPSEETLDEMKGRILKRGNVPAVKKTRLPVYAPLLTAAAVIIVGGLLAFNAVRRSGGVLSDETEPDTETAEITETSEVIETTAPFDLNPEVKPPYDLSPLKLLGDYYTETGEWFNLLTPDKMPCEFNPDLYRKYFFGVWESYPYDDEQSRDILTFDESEYGEIFQPFMGNIGFIGDTAVTWFVNGGAVNMYWVDTNNPDVMYHYISVAELSDRVFVYQRAGAANPPNPKYTSDMDIKELAKKYGGDFNLYDLITNIDVTFDGDMVFRINNYGFYAPKLLISESADRLEFYAYCYPAPIKYAVVKNGGVWELETITVGYVLPSDEAADKVDFITFANPVDGFEDTVPFGQVTREYDGFEGEIFHSGVDFITGYGANIYAVQYGTVVFAGNIADGYGNYIIIEHLNGLKTLYAHCSELLVSEGDEVVIGQVIAKVGSTGQSTGPHLHIEVIDGSGNKVDPMDYIPKG